ncbi:MAG: hypothetical protein KTR15_07550 [Phycisphaeraceae bacterium]|nr:hypothetical protein [Phycisphaeraceae bacterium]
MKRSFINLWIYLAKPRDMHSVKMKITGLVFFALLVVFSLILIISSPMYLYAGQAVVGFWFDIGIVAVFGLCLLSTFRRIYKLLGETKSDHGNQYELD